MENNKKCHIFTKIKIMTKIKTWLQYLDYNNSYWLMLMDENKKTTDIKITKKEFDRLKKFGIKTGEEILAESK